MRKSYKEKAISLRREGRTYSEILSSIPVAKSTLSVWFQSVGLAAPQKQRISALRKAAALRGAQARRNARLSEVHELRSQGKKDVGSISAREFWLIGIALYWGEGSKQRETTVSAGVQFTNSDSSMLRAYLAWLRMIGIRQSALIFELYVHETRASEIPRFKRWWAERLDISPKSFQAVYFKRAKILTKRKNTSDLYHGLVRIKVRSSTSLNRRIEGWVEGIVHQYPLGGRLMVGQVPLKH